MQTRTDVNNSCLLIYTLGGTEHSNLFLLFQTKLLKKKGTRQRLFVYHKEDIKKWGMRHS